MTSDELQNIVKTAKDHGLNRVILVVKRKGPPKGHRIRVNGIGLGEIANAQRGPDGWLTVAWFNVHDVDRYIHRYIKKIEEAYGQAGS